MEFEVEIYRNDLGEWVATAVAYAVSANGRTEQEALAMLMEAMTRRFKETPKA